MQLKTRDMRLKTRDMQLETRDMRACRAFSSFRQRTPDQRSARGLAARLPQRDPGTPGEGRLPVLFLYTGRPPRTEEFDLVRK